MGESPPHVVSGGVQPLLHSTTLIVGAELQGTRPLSKALVVLGMGADPKPDHGCRLAESEHTVMRPNTGGVERGQSFLSGGYSAPARMAGRGGVSPSAVVSPSAMCPSATWVTWV